MVKVADFYRRMPQVEVLWQDLPEDVILNTRQATSLLRGVQEGVNNALKHSGSERVEVNAACGAATLRIQISDQGRGFDPEENPAGFGLRNMQQRMAEAGGHVQVSSRKGEGTWVEIGLPLHPVV
ncbi:Sensor histidine kinase LiaS [compost metagenome]